MERTRSSAIVVVRVLGLAGVVMGVIWLVNLAQASCSLHWRLLPRSCIQSISAYCRV